MPLNDKTNALISEIKATAEFAQLKKAKSVIDRNGTLKTRLSEFNQKQMALANGKLPVKEAEAKINELNAKFEELSKIPEVHEFLEATKKFDGVLGKVYKEISESIGREIKI